MGIKLLVLAACFVPSDAGPVAVEPGDTVDVSKDEASSLARMGRALYISREDDPTKGTLTATADDKARVAKKPAAKGAAA